MEPTADNHEVRESGARTTPCKMLRDDRAADRALQRTSRLSHESRPPSKGGAPCVRPCARLCAGRRASAIFSLVWGAAVSERGKDLAEIVALLPRQRPDSATHGCHSANPRCDDGSRVHGCFCRHPLGAGRRMRLRRCGGRRRMWGINGEADEAEELDLPPQIRGRRRHRCAAPLPPYGRGPARGAQGRGGQGPQTGGAEVTIQMP